VTPVELDIVILAYRAAVFFDASGTGYSDLGLYIEPPSFVTPVGLDIVTLAYRAAVICDASGAGYSDLGL
jgi:hypothetical protein